MPWWTVVRLESLSTETKPKVLGSASLNSLSPSPSTILMAPLMKLDLLQKLSTSCSNIRPIRNELSLLSRASENKNSSLDILGYVNTTPKLTGPPEKSKCPDVRLDAVQNVEMKPVKNE